MKKRDGFMPKHNNEIMPGCMNSGYKTIAYLLETYYKGYKKYTILNDYDIV